MTKEELIRQLKELQKKSDQAQAAPVAESVPATVKEPWQMTLKEFNALPYSYGDDNKRIINYQEQFYNEAIDADKKSNAAFILRRRTVFQALWDKYHGIVPKDSFYEAQQIAKQTDPKISSFNASRVVREYENDVQNVFGHYGHDRSIEHHNLVQRAVAEGKPVPPEVLKDYPDL